MFPSITSTLEFDMASWTWFLLKLFASKCINEKANPMILQLAPPIFTFDMSILPFVVD